MPGVAVLFLVMLLIPWSIQISGVVMTTFRFFLLIAIIPLTARLLAGRAGPLTKIDGLIFAASGWKVLSDFVHYPELGTVELAGSQFVEFFGAYVVGRTTIRSAADMRVFVRWTFYSLFVLMPFAAFESITGRALMLEIFDMRHRIVNAGMRLGLHRAQVNFPHPTLFGAYAAATLSLVWYIHDWRSGVPARWLRAVPSTLATFFSLSSGALLAFNLQVLLMGYEWVMRRNPRRWALFGLGVLGAYIAISLYSYRSPIRVLIDRLTLNSGTGYWRLLIWEHASKNVFENPVFGIGLEDWDRPDWMQGVGSVDAYWLALALRWGTPTALLTLAGVVLLMRRAGRAPLSEPADRACRKGVLIALAGLVMVGFTVHYWLNLLCFFAFLIGAAVWLTDRREAAVAAQGARRRPMPARRPGPGTGGTAPGGGAEEGAEEGTPAPAGAARGSAARPGRPERPERGAQPPGRVRPRPASGAAAAKRPRTPR